MKCNFCGNNLLGSEKYCPECGTKVYNSEIIGTEESNLREKNRTTSIVLGIISLVGIFLGILAPISLIISIIGLVLAIKSHRSISNPIGIVLNSISLILSIIITILIALIIYFGILAIDYGIDNVDRYNDYITEKF